MSDETLNDAAWSQWSPEDLENFNGFMQNLQRSSPQILQSVAGGASTGAVVGPQGAAVGGFAGLVKGVVQAASRPQPGQRPRVAAPQPPLAATPGIPAQLAPPVATAPAAFPAGQFPPELAAQFLNLALSTMAGAGRPTAAQPAAAPAPAAAAPAPSVAHGLTPAEAESDAEDLFEWVVSSGMAESYRKYPRQLRGGGDAEQALPPLSPVSGGISIGEDDLLPGDIILSTTDAAVSRLIRAGSAAVVSHAGLYVGAGNVVEALGAGVIQQSLRVALSDDILAVAFRHPTATPRQLQAVIDFARAQRGRRYDGVGVFVEALFRLPGGPALRRVRLGTDHDDRFFCSELVIEAFEQAGAPLLTGASRDPGALAPLAGGARLIYVGHLKA